MSNGICWLASDGMRSKSSSSVISGSGTRFTITECPETELPTFFVFIFCVSKIFEMALATCGASIIAPSTTVSCASGSIPKLTSSYPAFVDFSSTALIELEPMSSPTNCLPFRPPIANIFAASFPVPYLIPNYRRLACAWLIFRSIQRSKIVLRSFHRLPSLNAGISPSVM